jgi:hypothetical protein
MIPPKYDHAMDFIKDKAAVYLNKKWGFVNKKGKILVPFFKHH